MFLSSWDVYTAVSRHVVATPFEQHLAGLMSKVLMDADESSDDGVHDNLTDQGAHLHQACLIWIGE